MKLQKALETLNMKEPPTTNLKQKLPQVYKVVKDCYLLSASCYIRLDEHKQTSVCLKVILRVEPTDVQALYLCGQSKEARPETAPLAVNDFRRAYEQLCKEWDLHASSKSFKTLRRALEAKLCRAGFNGSTLGVLTTGSKGSRETLNEHSPMFEIEERRGLGSARSRLGTLQSPQGRNTVRKLGMLLVFLSLLVVLLLVRKRKLVRKAVSACLRLVAPSAVAHDLLKVKSSS